VGANTIKEILLVTKREIQEDLDRLGIGYSARASKTELEALLVDVLDPEGAAAISEPEDTAPSSGTATSFEDVTGLCRQCNKPADHLHQGV